MTASFLQNHLFLLVNLLTKIKTKKKKSCYNKFADDMHYLRTTDIVVFHLTTVLKHIFVESEYFPGDDVSMGDPDDILDRFMAKQRYNR